jgi:hypothetical protein
MQITIIGAGNMARGTASPVSLPGPAAAAHVRALYACHQPTMIAAARSQTTASSPDYLDNHQLPGISALGQACNIRLIRRAWWLLTVTGRDAQIRVFRGAVSQLAPSGFALGRLV